MAKAPRLTTFYADTVKRMGFLMPSSPKQKQQPVPDKGDAQAAADRLRDRLGRRSGQRNTQITQVRDTQSGASRPRSALGKAAGGT